MKIDELFEALPGAQKQGFFGLFGGNEQAKRIKASIDQGVKSWINFATNYGKQNPTFLQDPAIYSKVFRQWAAKAVNLNANHPAFNDIETTLAATLNGRSEKPIKVAITKMVNLSQAMLADPNVRYTPDMKVKAVSALITKKYGKYIPDIAARQAIDKFIQDTMDATPNLTADDLLKATEAEVTKLVGTTTPPNRNPTSRRRPKNGDKVTYSGKQYTWTNRAWRSGTETLTGNDARAANAIFRGNP